MEWRRSKLTYLFVLFALGLFFYFFFVVKEGKPLLFDSSISGFLTDVFTKSSHSFFKIFNTVGSTIGIGIISLIVIAWLWLKRRDFTGMAVFVFAIALGNLLNKWLKDFVGRPRPETEHLVKVKSLSFPSGHAMMGIILYILIAYFIIAGLRSNGLKWLVAVIAGIIIVLMGISRIVMQVHYPSDVAAGLAAGFVWVYLWVVCYELLQVRKKE